MKRMECYGAPLDADKAVDSEGILAYIKAVRYLHALTGDDLYLDHMRDSIDYEFTFKFAYNSPVKVPPLSKIGWSSCGEALPLSPIRIFIRCPVILWMSCTTSYSSEMIHTSGSGCWIRSAGGARPTTALIRNSTMAKRAGCPRDFAILKGW